MEYVHRRPTYFEAVWGPRLMAQPSSYNPHPHRAWKITPLQTNSTSSPNHIMQEYMRHSFDFWLQLHLYTYTYIYIWSLTPLRHAKIHILPIYPYWLLGNDCENPNVQKSKNPKIKNPEIVARFRRCKKFWIFGVGDFWIFRFWDFWNFLFLAFWRLRFFDI